MKKLLWGIVLAAGLLGLVAWYLAADRILVRYRWTIRVQDRERLGEASELFAPLSADVEAAQAPGYRLELRNIHELRPLRWDDSGLVVVGPPEYAMLPPGVLGRARFAYGC